jgi:3-deoxy-7-phosphoheptulonate synthase
MPIGFKNGTGGSVDIAVDGIVAARSEHVFLGIDDNGTASIVSTSGNPGVHLVMRGGKTGTNYDAKSIASAQKMLEDRGLPANLIVDCSHANSGKDHRQQPVVFRDVMGQRASNKGIAGMMLESHLHEGSQSLGDDPGALDYGVSITDACVDWDETDSLIREAYEALG